MSYVHYFIGQVIYKYHRSIIAIFKDNKVKRDVCLMVTTFDVRRANYLGVVNNLQDARILFAI